MNRHLSAYALGFGFLCLFLISTAQAQMAPAHETGARVPGQYVVVFNNDVADPPGLARALARGHGLGLQHIYSVSIKGFSATIPEARLRQLQADPRIAYIEQDVVVRANVQELPTGIERIGGHLNSVANIDGNDGVDERVNVDVAVLDTGIMPDHEDLNVVSGTDCARGGPRGKGSQNGQPSDGHGHGTHVAGTIGALDNNLGVVGVAPGARLWPVKVLSDNGSGYMSWIIAGIDWVAARADKIEVANMSLGCGCQFTALDDAIAAATTAGVAIVVAAGNETADADNWSPSGSPGAISVAALADSDGLPLSSTGTAGPDTTCRSEADETFASFSNYGSKVALIAPGVCIESTYNNGGYAVYSGTSMAAPHVAGAAALVASQNPGFSPDEILTLLRGMATTDWFTQTAPANTTHALLNVDDSAGAPPINESPTVTIATPADGDTFTTEFATNTGITFAATVTDTEDDEANIPVVISWDSSIDGPLGDGDTVTASLSDGEHTITAAATDSGEKSGTDVITITVGDPATEQPLGSVSVSMVDHFANKRKMAVMIVASDTETKNPVSGATVSIRSVHDSGRAWSGSSTTGSDGSVTFNLVRAPTDGCYDTYVTLNGGTEAGPWSECSPWDGPSTP